MVKITQHFLPVDVILIQKIRPAPRLGDDFIAWAPEKSGTFSVRSAYKMASDELANSDLASTSSRADGSRDGWKDIWRCMVPPKVQSFAWRLASDSLATWKNKFRRSLEVSACCPVCGREDEDAFHVFCSCNHAVRLWEAMSAVWKLPKLKRINNTGQDWLFHVLSSINDDTRSRLLMLFWRIWFLRNEIVHSKPLPPMDASVHFLTSYLASLQDLQNPIDSGKGKAPIQYMGKQKQHTHHDTVPSSWTQPAMGRVKLNTDGSFVNGIGGAGMILRDRAGSIIFSSCRHLHTCTDALEAELLAIKEGISSSLQWSNLPIDIESDCLEAVSMIKEGVANRSKYAFIVREIILSMVERNSCIAHTRRNCNGHYGK